ncbi:MAG: porin [Candidatus Omnitrophota bacterium]
MKKLLFAVCIFTLLFTKLSSADEISDLKAELKSMQREIRMQAEKMQEMQKKIERLESKKVQAVEAPKSFEAKPVSTKDFNASWDNGLKLSTADKNFQTKIGTVIMADFAGMSEDSEIKGRLGKLSSPAEFRRLRAYTSGTVFKDYVYKLQVDFAGGDVGLRDAYAGIQNIPVLGLVRVGQFTAPFSLEDMTSSNYVTFMERSLPYALSIHRQTGAGFNSTFFDDRMTFAASLFFNSDSNSAVPISNALNAAARITGLVWRGDEADKKFLHLGAAYAFRNPSDKENFSYSSSPEIHLAPDFVDTGDFAGKYTNLLGLESALVYGPLSLQGEFIQSFVNLNDSDSTGYFKGLYAYASYFLTGEHRAYDKKFGVFARTKPINNFSLQNKTWGAWEVATRYSYLDFCTEDINGGALSDVTVGLNWYLNSGMRVMLNYVHAHRNGVGDSDIIATRFHVYF